MKILFTSVELLQAFRTAAEKLNIALTVIGADIAESAPALFFCDERRLVCKIQEKEYIPQLLSICEKEKVDCLIPTIDTDLLLLAENKEILLYILKNSNPIIYNRNLCIQAISLYCITDLFCF